ncbi:arginine--tRNA ligase [Chitinophaga sp. SYP-B3965]|uniref:arginine--tRNA ligase n=1 Tax=Chitinophaga sp. SYP-B3965 TaxID=2663120 RepID=UPI001299799F|nr:arginine--tRNA ligase [Chitinophaga sp. SYP-B3965]MRG48530.1 arginine--tRNA ligase [Chitinophaga sp. SYP-B3965]
MSVVIAIKNAAATAIQALYQQNFTADDVSVNITKPEFEGEYTVVVFSFTKFSRLKPEETGKQLGEYLLAHYPALFTGFNVVKGFLNLQIQDQYWIQYLQTAHSNKTVGQQPANGRKVMVEYSSPNTNKPLHLGHLRNNFLGYSVAEIYKANGFEVIKANLVNDRGIHICKSMLAWQMFSHGETPQSSGIKGDHLVGDFYVHFEKVLRDQAEPIISRVLDGNLKDFEGAEKDKIEKLHNATHKPEVQADKEKLAKVQDEIKELSRNKTEIMQQAKIMLQQWEAGNPEVRALWATMNGWVYEGFNKTYQRLGIDFDKMYYESNTYLLGKDLVEEGLRKGVLFRKEDNSVWIDLTADGLDEKLLLRGDGTSVYMTQDLGTARLKYDDYHMEESLYVVADEQNYHFKVLKLILQKLQEPCADGIYHLSYGMVELPHGRMKSREGTVVDADDLIEEMVKTAAEQTEELGKTKGFSEEELRELYETIGLGAMKFFLLKVDPKKKMVFNPEESIDLHGFTGPFIQYSYARIKSILREFSTADLEELTGYSHNTALLPMEKELIMLCEQFNAILLEAQREMSPAVIANYAFLLAQTFNSFYAKKEEGKYIYSVRDAENEDKKKLRLQIAILTANTIKQSLKFMGIAVPERM